MKTNSKPLYKRWWFILAAAFIGLAILGSLLPPSPKRPSSESTKPNERAKSQPQKQAGVIDSVRIVNFTWKQVDSLPLIDYKLTVANESRSSIKSAWLKFTMIFKDGQTGSERILILPEYPDNELKPGVHHAQAYRTGLSRSRIKGILEEVQLHVDEVERGIGL